MRTSDPCTGFLTQYPDAFSVTACTSIMEQATEGEDKEACCRGFTPLMTSRDIVEATVFMRLEHRLEKTFNVSD